MGFYARNLLLGLSLFAGFVFVTSFLALLLQSSLPPELCSCSPWAWLPYLIPILSSLGIFVGGMVFYLTDTWVKQRKCRIERRLAVDKILSCLPENERSVIRALQTGPMSQAQLGRATGLGKVRVHRIVKRLEDKGVVRTETAGRTKKVFLTVLSEKEE